MVDAAPEPRTDQADPNATDADIRQIDSLPLMKEVSGLTDEVRIPDSAGNSCQMVGINAVFKPKGIRPSVGSPYPGMYGLLLPSSQPFVE